MTTKARAGAHQEPVDASVRPLNALNRLGPSCDLFGSSSKGACCLLDSTVVLVEKLRRVRLYAPRISFSLNTTTLDASMGTTTETSGYLVFLLFIPLLTTIWIWVHIILASSRVWPVTYAMFARLDDCLETRDRLPHFTSILQLPRNVHHGRCRSVPSKVESRSM